MCAMLCLKIAHESETGLRDCRKPITVVCEQRLWGPGRARPNSHHTVSGSPFHALPSNITAVPAHTGSGGLGTASVLAQNGIATDSATDAKVNEISKVYDRVCRRPTHHTAIGQRS